MSNILNQFLTQKHEYFGSNTYDVQDKDFEISIGPLIVDPKQV